MIAVTFAFAVVCGVVLGLRAWQRQRDAEMRHWLAEERQEQAAMLEERMESR